MRFTRRILKAALLLGAGVVQLSFRTNYEFESRDRFQRYLVVLSLALVLGGAAP